MLGSTFFMKMSHVTLLEFHCTKVFVTAVLKNTTYQMVVFHDVYLFFRARIRSKGKLTLWENSRARAKSIVGLIPFRLTNSRIRKSSKLKKYLCYPETILKLTILFIISRLILEVFLYYFALFFSYTVPQVFQYLRCYVPLVLTSLGFFRIL